jgi:transposase
MARIEQLMEHETAGDLISGLKWTQRSTAKVAAELRSLGIEVSPRTVARLLKKLDFSLRVNHQKLSGAAHPPTRHPVRADCRVA